MWKRSGPHASDSDLRKKYAKDKLDRYHSKRGSFSSSSYFEGSNSRSIILIQLFLLFLTIICCIYFYIDNNNKDTLLTESSARVAQLTKEQSTLSEQLATSKQQIDAMHRDLENKHKDAQDAANDPSDPNAADSANIGKNEENAQFKQKYDDMVKSIQQYSLKTSKVRYGGSNQVKVRLDTNQGVILLELAPFDVMPHATRYFLDLVESGYWNKCHIFRAAHHVLQANCHHKTNSEGEFKGPNWPDRPPSLLFQEYNENYLHNPYTIGIAGRPGGPDFYINLVDNIKNHGPGGQGPEPDPCFGKVVQGFDVIDKIKKLKVKSDSRMMVLEDDQWVEFYSVTVVSDDS